ncbi:MAG: adenosine kinase, partial [Arenicella sp.]|nr:adenosine kinase [Arenicella sp.]
MKKYDVYGIGNALVDTEYEVEDTFIKKTQFDKGVMTLIETEDRLALIDLLENQHEHKVIHQCGGGSAANTMVAISQLGGENFYSCKVASDAIGDFFMADLKAVGLDTNLDSGREDGVSGQCISMITPDAERTMTTHLGISSELAIADLDEQALANSRYLYIEGYLVTSPNALAAALKAQEVAKQNN